jgi:7 transmembrane helices usually fused to an inactive transglutaminase/Transglutaminase-like superfamily
MNPRVLSYVSVVACLLLGSGLIALRHHARQSAKLAEEESLWSLSYEINFEPVEKGASINIYVPIDTPYCEVRVGKPSHLGLRSERRGNRIVATAPQPGGPYKINAEFELRLSPRADLSRAPEMEYLKPDVRQRYLKAEPGIPAETETVRAVAQKALDGSETISERIQWIFRYCSDIPAGATDDPALILSQTETNASPLGRARTMVALARSIGIPARLVTGFEIKQKLKVDPLVWVEVFQGQSWVPFDPTNGFTRSLPPNFIPVRRGGDQPIRLDPDSSKYTAEYSIVRLEPPLSVLRTGQRHPVQILDLSRLPIPMHKVLRVLLLLPFGALITTIIRNVVGIGTFGTFSPALLAMSFIYANWQTGVAILLIVIMAGTVSRTFLERLRLLAVPRLSIILTIVILCVVFGMSILYYLVPEIVTDAVLLPMVILTMLIERFYVTTEEDGLMYTLQLATGTLVVASLVYAILAWRSVGQFVLVYPESHLFTIAVFILLGRYAGYRITELWRFRDLVTTSETKP